MNKIRAISGMRLSRGPGDCGVLAWIVSLCSVAYPGARIFAGGLRDHRAWNGSVACRIAYARLGRPAVPLLGSGFSVTGH
jgi:hypothetical protein